LQDYRAQLDRQHSSFEPVVPVAENTAASEPQLNTLLLENDRQVDRDTARQETVQALEIKQTQAMMETYIKASSKK